MKFLKLSAALVTVLVALSFVTQASAQVFRKYTAISNSVPLTTTATNLINNTTVFVSPKGQGVAFQAQFAATNAASVNVGFQFVVSVDGTNYNNLLTWWHVAALNGTAGVVTYTNFPPAAIANASKIKLTQITNAHTSTVFLTNAWFGQVFDK